MSFDLKADYDITGRTLVFRVDGKSVAVSYDDPPFSCMLNDGGWYARTEDVRAYADAQDSIAGRVAYG